MKEGMKTKLEAAIDACSKKTENAERALVALQYSQAAVNLSNVIVGLSHDSRQEK
jgi:hypothetical protein